MTTACQLLTLDKVFLIVSGYLVNSLCWLTNPHLPSWQSLLLVKESPNMFLLERQVPRGIGVACWLLLLSLPSSPAWPSRYLSLQTMGCPSGVRTPMPPCIRMCTYVCQLPPTLSISSLNRQEEQSPSRTRQVCSHLELAPLGSEGGQSKH